MLALRVCRYWGLEAYTEDELELFVQDKSSHYGRKNLCKNCRNSFSRKSGKYHSRRAEYDRKYAIENRERRRIIHTQTDARRILFKGQRITLEQNPRTNICSQCGRRYPQELNQQTVLHHIFYDPDDPLKGTIELCVLCHNELHAKEQNRDGKGRFVATTRRELERHLEAVK